MVLAGTESPRKRSGVGSLGRQEDTTAAGQGSHVGRPPTFVLDSASVLSAPCRITPSAGHPHWKELCALRRYELMLVIRPDVADDKSQALGDRTTRGIVASGGQIVKVAPWGRRRLAYPIDRHREGSYHIILFEAPSDSIVELEHTLLITEEVLRHLITRVERPAKAGRGDGTEIDGLDDADLPSGLDDEEDDVERPEFIDESESEA